MNKRIEQGRRADARVARLNARDREIVRRVKAGENMADIARDHRITRARVSQIARMGGVDPRPRPLHHHTRQPLSVVALLRVAKDWTQDELAHRARVSRTTVQRAERGDMTDTTWERLRAALEAE